VRADTFARLVVLETLVDAEIGHRLELGAPSAERWVEAMVARISDLVDEIDALDAVTAARTYDALVDFLTELPEEDDALVEQAVRFKRDVDRIVERGLDGAALHAPQTWATVTDELLAALAGEHSHGDASGGGSREHLRARYLANRARMAAERMVATQRREKQGEVRNALDRLVFAVHNRRLHGAAMDALIADARRIAAGYRPTPLVRIGGHILRHLLRRRRDVDAP
jgi:hypothetical protein